LYRTIEIRARFVLILCLAVLPRTIVSYYYKHIMFSPSLNYCVGVKAEYVRASESGRWTAIQQTSKPPYSIVKP